MKNENYFKENFPEIAYLNPYSIYILTHNSDPIIISLLGRFESVLSSYDNIENNPEYVNARFSNDVKSLTRIMDEYIDELTLIHKELVARVEVIEETGFSRKLAIKTYVISVIGAIAAIAAAILSYIK